MTRPAEPLAVTVWPLAAPNNDLAVEDDGRVWKLKPDGWVRLDYMSPLDSAMFASRSRESIEVTL